MKIVRFLGGLGNQMFQYAFYLSLSKKFQGVKADLSKFDEYKLHNGFELDKVFDIQLTEASKFETRLLDNQYRKWGYRKLRKVLNKKNAYTEEKELFTYNEDIFADKKDRLYWGYWQNINYLRGIELTLKKHLTFKQELDDKNRDILTAIEQSNSVGIHVRRGDYINDPLLGGIATLDYYLQAIELIIQKVEAPSFFIFSNDINWCKENFNLARTIYVHGNIGSNGYIDMLLMSKCKHQIIANSSFSWWAAWLNENPEKTVIAPKTWANGIDNSRDVCPTSWIRI